MNKVWKKEINNNNAIIWRNIINNSLTVEIHSLEDDKDFNANYYVFPAKDGRGIPNSPELFIRKKDAVDYAKKYMRKEVYL